VAQGDTEVAVRIRGASQHGEGAVAAVVAAGSHQGLQFQKSHGVHILFDSHKVSMFGMLVRRRSCGQSSCTIGWLEKW